MTLLGWYVTVGLPLNLIAMDYGVVRLADRDRRSWSGSARLTPSRAAKASLRQPA